MQKRPHCDILLFYSNHHPQSQRTRFAVHEYMAGHPNVTINLHEVDYELEKKLCEKHGISGIPTLVCYQDNSLAFRRLGEITLDEFENNMTEFIIKAQFGRENHR